MERAIQEWRKVFRGDVRIKDDTALTYDDMDHANLILWGDPGRITGHCIIAPGGSLLHTWVGDDGALFTYDEDDHTAQWWSFRPNAVPEPLGPLLTQVCGRAASGASIRGAIERASSSRCAANGSVSR